MKKHLLFLFLLFSVFFYSQSDCAQSVSICGNGDIYYDPNGYGTQEIDGSNSCGYSERHSIWFKITVKTAGTLGFTLTPDIPQDYDFYLFGPNKTCANKGNSLRCSTSGATGNTGMNATSQDIYETPTNAYPSGVIDGFVKNIDVLPGETYLLCVTRYTLASTGGFNLTWNGTATLDDPFEDAEYSFQAPEPVYVCNNPFDFSTLTNGILNGNTGFVVTYHQNGNDVTTGNNPITTPINVSTKDYYYRIKSTDPSNSCFQSGIIQMNYVPLILTATQVTLKQCPDDNGQAVFNLSTAVFTSTAGVTKKYYPTQEDMDNGTNEITNFTNYLSGSGEIFVKLKNQYDCTKTAKIILSLYQRPTVNDDAVEICEVGGVGIFDLSQANVTSSTGITKKYFTDYDSAMNNTVANQITNFTAYSSTGGDVYVRVENSDGCFRVAKITLLFNEKPQVNDVPLSVCSGETTANFNLSSAVITNETGVTKKYYPTYDDAYNQVAANEITNPTAYPSSGGTVYVRVMRSNQCYDIAEITLTLNALPNTQDVTIMSCEVSGTGIYDLSSANVTSSPGVTKKYYPSLTDLNNETNEILDYTAFTGVEGTQIYVKIANTKCSDYAVITLAYYNTPQVTDRELKECRVSSTVYFDLSEANTTPETGVTKKYYPSIPDLNAGTNEITNFTQYPSNGGNVFVKISNIHQCYDVAKIELIVMELPVVNDTQLQECRIGGVAVFDLSEANITSEPGVTKKYYPSMNDLNSGTNEITDFTNYISNGQIVYVLVENGNTCTNIAEITLKVNPFPQFTMNNFIGEFCDVNLDGKIPIDFSLVKLQILSNSTDFNVKFYLNENDALAGNNNTLPLNWQYSQDTSVYVRVESLEDCVPQFKTLEFKVSPRYPLLSMEETKKICDDDTDGIKEINLDDYKDLFTTDSNALFTYYATYEDAQNEVNPIPALQTIAGNKDFYFRVESAEKCANIGVLHIIFSAPKLSETLHDETICEFDTITLDAGPGFDSYFWSTGETTQSIEAMVGEYSVILTYNGCPISQSVTVFKSEDPVLEGVEIIGTTVTIHASGGLPPLWYSIDGITYQTSNVFENVRKGIYTAYVKSTGICPSITAEFSVVEINNAITPNKDGFNDVMDYSVLKTKNNVKLQVYNREGALIFSGAASNNYVWDGTFAGRPVQSGTYWYIITYNEPYQNTPVLMKGWVLLKNRD